MDMRLVFVTSSLLVSLTLSANTMAAEPSLREIMQHLNSSLGVILEGMLLEDYEQIAEGAEGIAHHAHIVAPQVERIAEELGAEMAVFSQFDEQVHDLSVSIAELASERDRGAIQLDYHHLVDGCLGCHALFRTRLSSVLNP